jgi:hypothetical protein
MITIEFGRHSLIEFSPEYPEGVSPIACATAIWTAVLDGRCSERLWLRADGSVARSAGAVELPHRTIETSHVSGRRKDAGEGPVEVRYAPYLERGPGG